LPSEAARFQRAVGDRDRRFFAALGLLAAAGSTAGVLLFGHGGTLPAAGGCVSYAQAGVMGGGSWRFCGADAAAFCRQHAGEDRRLDARCRQLSSATRD
jgi:hypothetical protein